MNPSHRKLALVIHSLEGGGAERVLANMANHWAGNGNDVSLITLSGDDDDRYPLDAQVRRVGLGVMCVSTNPLSAMWNNVVRVRKLRQAIRESQAEIAISFTEKMNVLTLLAIRRLAVKVIICERIDPRWHRIGRAWSLLRKLTYPRCSAAVVQTSNVKDFVQSLVGRQPVFVIPNGVDSPASKSEANPDCPPCIVSMGRLCQQKGFDLLIEAFQQVAKQHPAWRLRILGEGPDSSALQQQAGPLGDRVEFCGWQSDTISALQDAEIFAMASRYEGFPNALLEAMACGLAVVSFDCPSGPSEIVRHELDGLLVPPEDTNGLAQALDLLMSSEERRHELAEQARSVLDRFSTRLYYERWDRVLRGDPPTSASRESDTDAVEPG